MKRAVTALSTAVVVIAVLALAGSAYTVSETEQVIITQFGRPIGRPITSPGLHWKIPFIQKVQRFDKRFLEWDGDANQLPTRDKRFIYVDTYARWRISDALLFFQRLRDEQSAQTRLDDILDGSTRDAIAKHDLLEVIRTSNRVPLKDTSQEGEQGVLQPIKYGRDKIRKEILNDARERSADLGIEILDLQFKRINYVSAVQRKVYDRMIAERQRIADRYRSEGQGEAADIIGKMNRDLKKIQSQAYRQAQEINGKADAQATTIYAAAYNRSSDTRRFYAFLKSMETLKSTADKDTTVVLSTNGELYRYLQDGGL